jgi:hypothetical protein
VLLDQNNLDASEWLAQLNEEGSLRWELVSVVPHDHLLVAFLKRPVQ